MFIEIWLWLALKSNL